MHETNTEVQKGVIHQQSCCFNVGAGARSCVLLYRAETHPSVTEESSQGGLMQEDTID